MRKELNQILKNATKLVANVMAKYEDLVDMVGYSFDGFSTRDKRAVAILKAIQIEHDNNNPEKSDITEFELINKLKDTVYYLMNQKMIFDEIEIDILHDDRVEIKQGETVVRFNRNFNGYSEPF